MALNSSTKRAIIDLLLSVLTMIVSFFQTRLNESEDSLALSSRQQAKLQKAARKAQALIPEDTNQEEGI